MKCFFSTVLKGAFIKLLFLLGIVTAGTLTKTYAPAWLYTLLFFGAILYVCIWMFVPEYTCW
ncbi:hypothetical protein [Bacteroides ihuae]|uniref:hypothetical protein n=1 Tax=Bacteroides ihuae TaxID=1852362 RepID=UPI001396756A|nr:hypothetical protein [Bacteroides ihuae]